MQYHFPQGVRRWLPALAAAAIVCLVLAAVLFFLSPSPAQPSAQYLLKDNAGQLALYAPDGTGPLARYEVYTHLLPEADFQALQHGITIYTDAELQQKLEDYGL